MSMYPDVDIKKKKYPLQSILFGHRIQPSQTKYEYLIEFLQVAIAKKRKDKNAPDLESTSMFPVEEAPDGDFVYIPEVRIGLKRFIFFPRSKIDGKAKVDEAAYQTCVRAVEARIQENNPIKRQNSITVVQNLLRGFSAVNQSRSWFDQNVLPICPEVILPEGMGVKSWRQKLVFSDEVLNGADLDGKFDYHKYTYMCRGGEVYYLHLLNALTQQPEKRVELEERLNKLIHNYPQFSQLCKFIQNTWNDCYPGSKDLDDVVKELGAIPTSFSERNKYTLIELENLLKSKAHPFEKMEMLANGMILQIMRMMYLAAATDTESNCWVVDVNCAGFENTEVKKRAISAFKHNEEVISTYLYKGLADNRHLVGGKNTEQKIIKDAANDSYRLFRKMGKMIGVVIPNTGKGMRFSVSEDIIKFLVLAIIPPKNMLTLDTFVDKLYEHFGMVIGPEQYKKEMKRGSVAEVGDFSFLEANVDALAQKLKDCGFLRDLSDATSIVENPYEEEGLEA